MNIKLTTHDAGNRVTYNDLKFAQFVRDEFERERPQNVLKMQELIKNVRGQFSFSQASQIIDDLVASDKSSNLEKASKHSDPSKNSNGK